MGLFILKRLNLPALKKDKVLRKFPYQMTNKEFKASHKKVIRANPIGFFLASICSKAKHVGIV